MKAISSLAYLEAKGVLYRKNSAETEAGAEESDVGAAAGGAAEAAAPFVTAAAAPFSPSAVFLPLQWQPTDAMVSI